MDHPEYFADLNAYLDSFEKFLMQTKGTIVANLQDPNVAHLIKDVMKQSKVSALDFNKIEADLKLQVPGKHNISNAKAAFQVGLILGLEPYQILNSLNAYSGVSRRFEYLGDFQGCHIYSDFGHHPREIEQTMLAARERFPKQKIWLFYEPHMFSRTKALFDDFVQVFQNLPVDGVVITDIYPSRETDTGLVNAKQLVEAINRPHTYYSAKLDVKEFAQYSHPGEIFFFMGAGDIDSFARKLVN